VVTVERVPEAQDVELDEGDAWGGWCAVCGGHRRFVVRSTWLRDGLICDDCGTVPRNRRVIAVLDLVRPDWASGDLWEIAPFGPTSARLQSLCDGYLGTHYWPDLPPGGERWGYTCQDVEAPTFPDASFDVVVSQDVFEHVFNWAAGMRSIARVLRPGGVHVWTTPRLRNFPRSAARATLTDGGEVEHLAEPEYHGNPVADGSLVTMDWGMDLEQLVGQASGLDTMSVRLESRYQGMLGSYSEVFVSRKA
jgi:Methyltransferase domain